ncbi:HNH endonuclease [Bacillus sp. FJAT-49705]|uniref:Putative HNH nuclease YajD n=1 Tax=Cytobacillus citreus TaxID=2833586 RepID=A0ABS5NTP9_9BACI|nr:HNH endonuclease [Cytobacillus citreus]MBS4191201.1 HNH endonuclease [Cytobacillus citreus]
MKQTNPFYKSKKWINKRENVLRRDDYECRECKRYGKTTVATMVHHIFPLEHYPEYKLNSDNLISLCSKCHERMHDRITNEISEVGKRWQGRVEGALQGRQ